MQIKIIIPEPLAQRIEHQGLFNKELHELFHRHNINLDSKSFKAEAKNKEIVIKVNANDILY